MTQYLNHLHTPMKTVLLTSIMLTTLTAAASPALAEQFFCISSAQVSIDKHAVTSNQEAPTSEGSAEQQSLSWIVDTRRGWRRSDVDFFGGSCVEEQGYIVCKEQNLTFGEATLSLHPDHRNFLLVYMDYGLDALAFVGSCSKYPN